MYDQHLPEINSKKREDTRMTEKHVVIDASLVHRLILSQFPQWKELSILLQRVGGTIELFI